MAMVLSHCLPPHNLLRHVDWPVVAVIAAAIGISAALTGSGAARMVAEALLAGAAG